MAISVFTVKSFNFKFENFYDYNVVEKVIGMIKKMGILGKVHGKCGIVLFFFLNYLISP